MDSSAAQRIAAQFAQDAQHDALQDEHRYLLNTRLQQLETNAICNQVLAAQAAARSRELLGID